MRTFFSGCMLFTVLCSSAQPYNQAISAKSYGFGDASSAYADQWALFNNVGGIARIKSTVSLFSVHRRYQIHELDAVHAGIVLPAKKSAIGISVNRFGRQLHSENQIGLALGHKLGLTSWGIKINFLNQTISGHGDRNQIVLEFGAMLALTSNVMVAIYIYNLKFNHENIGNRLVHPLIIKSGFHYQLHDKLSILAEVQKDDQFPAVLKFGILYEVIQSCSISTGIHPTQDKIFFGLGYRFKNINIDYAIQSHTSLGLSHLFSFSFQLNQHDEKGDKHSNNSPHN